MGKTGRRRLRIKGRVDGDPNSNVENEATKIDTPLESIGKDEGIVSKMFRKRIAASCSFGRELDMYQTKGSLVQAHSLGRFLKYEEIVSVSCLT